MDSDKPKSLEGNPLLLMDVRDFFIELQLGRRTRNALVEDSELLNYTFFSAAHFLAKTEPELLELPYFGRKCVNEFSEVLKMQGLYPGITARYIHLIGDPDKTSDPKEVKRRIAEVFNIPIQSMSAPDGTIIKTSPRELTIKFGDKVDPARIAALQQAIAALTAQHLGTSDDTDPAPAPIPPA
jgi:hypothetical protein